MNITDVQANDLIEINQIKYIVLKPAHRLSEVGQMADTYRVRVYSARDAATADDGIMELGSQRPRTVDVDNTTPVTVIRSNVEYRDLWSYLPPEKRHLTEIWQTSSPDAFARANLALASLKRKQRQQEAAAADGAFRLRVRKALESGIPVAEIREITGLSRERVYQIRDNRR